ncbi:MAG: hypothetical protein ABIF08_03095 [Nanoarchaeota archaeon]
MDMILFQGPFGQIITSMQNMGFFLYLFPFLLALALLYGIMEKTLSGTLPKPARALISIILSFFVMLFVSWNPAIVTFFATLSGTGLLVLSGLLFLMIILGFTGFNIKEHFSGEHAKWVWVLVIILIVVLLFFGAGAGNFINMPSWSMTSDFWTALFFIAILAAVMFWMGKDDKPAATKPAGGRPSG